MLSASASSSSVDRKGKGRARQNSFLAEPEVSRILQATLSDDGYDDEEGSQDEDDTPENRWLLLACACCFGMGAHYSTHVLAPLKSSLGASESGFSSLIASFQLMNTVTPLLSGFLVPRYGAARCGIIATGFIASGQAIVMFSAPHNLSGMVMGLALFGAGVSPLAVVQETILAQIAPKRSKITNKTIAGGLLLGKASSWFAAILAVPLQRISPQLPFVVAFSLSLFSFLACLLYAKLERSSHLGLHSPPDHRQKQLIDFREPPTYGDPFWIYTLVCSFAGAWATVVHLSTNLLESLYDVSAGRAAANASLILFTSPFLYPLIGWQLDRRPQSLSKMYYAAIGLICVTFALLLMAPLVPMILAVFPSAIGIGAGTLLLVVIVPRIVEPQQIATALGIHKSVEMAGAVINQTITSFILRSAQTKFLGAYYVSGYFLAFFGLQLIAAVALWLLVRRRIPAEVRRPEEAEEEVAPPPPEATEATETTKLLDSSEARPIPSSEHTRGKIGMTLTLGSIVVSWVAFFGNLIMK